jgi:hypothetical protein
VPHSRAHWTPTVLRRWGPLRQCHSCSNCGCVWFSSAGINPSLTSSCAGPHRLLTVLHGGGLPRLCSPAVASRVVGPDHARVGLDDLCARLGRACILVVGWVIAQWRGRLPGRWQSVANSARGRLGAPACSTADSIGGATVQEQQSSRPSIAGCRGTTVCRCCIGMSKEEWFAALCLDVG